MSLAPSLSGRFRTTFTHFGRLIKAAPIVLCGLALAAHPAQAAAPPAGTSIGNQASATYTDASNTPRTATSNITVTIVQQVSSFSLTADGAQFAAPGGQVYYPHTIVNTGNGTDTFTLGSSNNGGDDFDLTSLALYADADGDGLPDDTTPITTSGAVAAGGTFRFVAVGIVPGTATSTQTASISVTAVATATATPAPLQTNTDVTTVTGNAVINVTKLISSNSGPAGSGPHTITLRYTNTGNASAVDLVLADTLPAGMTYVAGSGRWSVTGATVLTDGTGDLQGTAPDQIDYDFGATTAGTVTATISRVQPGESRTVTFDVTITAGQPAGGVQNTAAYSYDPGTGSPIGPFNTNTVNFTVTQGAAVDIVGATVASATQGSTVAFTNVVTNNGNGPDSFDIVVSNVSFPAGTTLALFKSDGNTPLVDTNGNSVPDTGTLAPGASYSVVMKATLPTGASGTGVNYTATKTATSHVDAGVSDADNDVLTTVTANTVDVTNNAPGGAGAGAGPEAGAVTTNTTNPGTTTRFVLYVNNTSSVSDSYNLAASSDASFASITLPAGWTAVFRDSSNAVITSTGVIAAGGNKLVNADITVPAGATGTQDIYFRALSATSGAVDIKHDAVAVNTIRTLAITGGQIGQTYPGGTVVYSHTLTNNGNVLEGDGGGSTVTLSLADTLGGWSSVIYYDANNNGIIDPSESVVTDLTFVSGTAAGLSPGESVRLLVKVSAPPGATLGAIDQTTITATTANAAYTTTVPAAVSVADSTTVVAGDLSLLKEQALDSQPDGTPDGPYATANISTGAQPGTAIRYRITATNTGTAPATSVKIFDTTPAFTTYTSTNPAAVTGGSSPSVTTVPADGAAGNLEFNVGTLNPGESAIATFGVIIDPVP